MKRAAGMVQTNSIFTLLLFLGLFSLPISVNAAEAPLPSWNEGASKEAILSFVAATVDESGSGYVPPRERIAVFDNDGTLWAEQPLYFQLFFALDRIKQLAPAHPEWQETEPFASLLKGDVAAALAGGEEAIMKIVMASHSNVTTEEFEQLVLTWMEEATHPTTGRPYHEMVYQPMLELLHFLRDNQFTTYIVSGGGIEFMRPWTEKVYGIPPEQVIGSSVKTQFEFKDGEPRLLRLPELNFINDKAGKPVAINLHIGQRPLAAFGNSDGDLQMLQWTTARKGPSFALFIHHTDGKREWAYDRDSSIGRLAKGLDEAQKKGWTVVNMAKDWKLIYPFELQ